MLFINLLMKKKENKNNEDDDTLPFLKNPNNQFKKNEN